MSSYNNYHARVYHWETLSHLHFQRFEISSDFQLINLMQIALRGFSRVQNTPSLSSVMSLFW